MGSRGVTQISKESELEAAFVRAQTLSRNGEVLVEEFADGPEFSIEALTWNGRTEIIAITDKITTGSPYWVEMGHTQPTAINAAQAASVKSATIDGINALERETRTKTILVSTEELFPLASYPYLVKRKELRKRTGSPDFILARLLRHLRNFCYAT